MSYEEIEAEVAAIIKRYRNLELLAADAILSLKYPNGNPMVYVAAEDQSLPDVKGDYAWLSRKGEQKMMTQAGFRRILEKGSWITGF